ncbi:pali-domain-containing protein [Piedraia hortae CBS 480.64]|uniref:Pali-domain-containing protein n=1 Tax=Piedraia hortae CBS 480.64 TaxID=1314780 RepID=A0A6A7BSR7_9PEZI|nr:pali-domain-containing protein [Piedraia hortae CBS 480.64]
MNRNSLLRVTLPNETQIRHSSVTFGTFGYCILDVPPIDSPHDWCTKQHVGYSPARIISNINAALANSMRPFSEISSGVPAGLTRIMVLHPISCALAFIALLLSVTGGVAGTLLGATATSLAWILTLIALVTDFVTFGVVRRHVNVARFGIDDAHRSHAKFGSAIWLLVAAFVFLSVAMMSLATAGLAAWKVRKQQRQFRTYTPSTAVSGGHPRRKRFWIF